MSAPPVLPPDPDYVPPEPVDPGPQPIIPPEQQLSAILTPTGQPLCYATHPDSGRRCDLTMYHSGGHHTRTANGDDAYWDSDVPPGPIPDPYPPPEFPLQVPPPNPDIPT